MEWLNANAPAIQAVGSLIAIATSLIAITIAIWVPFRIHSNQERERQREIRLRGQAMALLIDPLLRAIDGEIEHLGTLRPEDPSQIDLPESIMSLSDHMWLMGEAGGSVLQLIGIIQIHNRILEETPILPIDMEEEQRLEFARLFHERLGFARECISEALAAIDRLIQPNE